MSDSSLQLCPSCGTPVDADAVFCGACGTDLHAEAVPAEVGAPVGGTAERGEAEEGSHAAFAEKSHAESAKFAEFDIPVGGAVEQSEAERGSRAVSLEEESHAESAEFAEFAEFGVPVGGATERSEASGVLRARTDPSAEESTKRSPTVSIRRGELFTLSSVPQAPAFSPIRASDWPAAVPFMLEWDEARQFIEGQAGTFVFRLTARWNLAKVGVAASVDGEDLPPVVFSGLRRGDVREGTFDFTPQKPGQLSVRLCVETIPRGLVHECFAANRDVSHLVRTKDSKKYVGPGSVTQTATVDNRNDKGLTRAEGQRISQTAGGETTDNWNDQDRVLARRTVFQGVGFALGAVRRENALVRTSAPAGLSELLVLPGTDLVTFGTSSRADAGLFVETADGYTDEHRTGYVSGFHLSIQRDPKREAFVLRDGGPDWKAATKPAWRKSTNGVTVDDADLRGEFLLRPGAKLRVCLAPYAVQGGALPLEIETKGWDDPAAAGCEDHPGNLSSLLVRRLDNPRKAILVVWGAAALDPILGTRTGLRAACAGGRLFRVKPDGTATRFHRLAGQTLPGTSFTIA